QDTTAAAPGAAADDEAVLARHHGGPRGAAAHPPRALAGPERAARALGRPASRAPGRVRGAGLLGGRGGGPRNDPGRLASIPAEPRPRELAVPEGRSGRHD